MIHQYTLETEKEFITINVVRSNRKTIGLEVKEDTSVYIRVPKKSTDKKVMQVIEKNRNWLMTRYEQQKARKEQEIIYSEAETKRFRLEAKRVFTEIATHYAEIMGVTYDKIFIREQKTCWGSCSSKKNISFNWKLILYPKEAQEYVIVHELAHLKYMNHSIDFWKEVERILPDYKTRQKLLKR